MSVQNGWNVSTSKWSVLLIPYYLVPSLTKNHKHVEFNARIMSPRFGKTFDISKKQRPLPSGNQT